MRESNKNDINSLKDEVSRVYDFNKWFIGLIFTTIIGFLTLAVGILFQKKRTNQD